MDLKGVKLSNGTVVGNGISSYPFTIETRIDGDDLYFECRALTQRVDEDLYLIKFIIPVSAYTQITLSKTLSDIFNKDIQFTNAHHYVFLGGSVGESYTLKVDGGVKISNCTSAQVTTYIMKDTSAPVDKPYLLFNYENSSGSYEGAVFTCVSEWLYSTGNFPPPPSGNT